MGIAVFSGLTLGVLLNEGLYAAGATMLVGCVFLTLAYTQRVAVFITIGVVLCCAAIGMARVYFAVPHEIIQIPKGVITFEGEVVREPDIREHHVNLVVKTPGVPHLVLVRAPKTEVFHWHDVVSVVGELEVPEDFSTDTGRMFGYRMYLAKDGVYALTNAESVEVLSSRRSVRGTLHAWKTRYTATLSRVLPEPYAALAAGITVGERRALGDVLTQQFRQAGLIHIVVLSGYNIAIILLAVIYMFSGLPRRARAVCALFAILVFVLLVGPSATVVRAGIMGALAVFGVLFERTYQALHALLVAGVMMILWNPLIVAHDPSFQLSFCATVGVLLGTPLLQLSFVPKVLGIRDLVATTLATQIAVLPLLIYLMGEVSLVGVFVNVVTLPLIPLAMLLVGVAGVTGWSLIAFGAYGILSYVVFVVEWVTQLSFATVVVPEISVWVMGGMYVVIWGLYEKRKRAAV